MSLPSNLSFPDYSILYMSMTIKEKEISLKYGLVLLMKHLRFYNQRMVNASNSSRPNDWENYERRFW